jgi:hypothetical protein
LTIRSASCHQTSCPLRNEAVFSPTDSAEEPARKRTFKVAKGKPVESVFLAFGDKGTKVIYASPIGVHNKDEGLITFYRLKSISISPASGKLSAP